MIRRSLGVGLLAGVILSLAGLYPAITLFMPLWFPDWVRPAINESLHSLLLMLSAAIFVPAFLSVGIFAARRAQARDGRTGFKTGALAGLIACLILYIALISPLSALNAYGGISTFEPMSGTPLPPASVADAYVETFEESTHLVYITLLVGMIFWGLEGLAVGWRQRNWPVMPKPNLYNLVATGKNPRKWFADNESTIKAGLTVGALFAILLFVTVFSQFYVFFAEEWPDLAVLIEQNQEGMFRTGPAKDALPLLWPFLGLGLATFGAAVVIMSKHPPSWFISRVQGSILAGTLIWLTLFTIGLRIFYFNLGLLPFVIHHWAINYPEQAMEFADDGFSSIELAMGLQHPYTLVGIVLIAPWVMMLMAAVLGMIVGGLQGILYVPLISPFVKRPVDRATAVHWRLRREPNNIIPLIYDLFQHNDAYEVMAHLSAQTYRPFPDVSRFLAAYHTLGSSQNTADHLETLEEIQAVLDKHQAWRWAPDLSIVYHSLHQVLSARTLEQILAIKHPHEQQTVSLPPSILQSVQAIKRIITELGKSAQVEDLSTRVIFLENGLAAIHDAQQHVNENMDKIEDGCDACVPSPESVALANVLEHWQGIVLNAIQRLKGRADVSAELQSRHCTRTATMPLLWLVSNKGLNVAQQVRLRVLPGSDYHVVNGEAVIDILPPGEEQQLMVHVNPREMAPRLRVEWEVLYDDAVDADRAVAAADVIEFAESERPFQRIFPIPYVTGTPLKTDDVFVGRDDVFAFIRENLVGAHQNNVIILHGQRRTGKTSVLYRLGQVMTDTHYGVLIDMQGKPARGELDFLYSIADDITFALEDHDIFVEMPDRAEFEAQGPEFYFRARFLRSLYPHLNGKNLLLMFDEFEELQRRVEDGRLQPEIFQFLRNLMQHEERVDFVFSGTHKLEDLGAEYWSVLFNIAAYKPITFLSPSEVERLILGPIAEYNVEYDPLAIDRIIHVAAGHPYFTQLILHEMIVYHNETQRSYLTVADVNQALERIVERGEAHFKYIWSESSEEERIVLLGFTELMVGEKPANVEDLRGLLWDRGQESADNWAGALANLEGRDILTRSSLKSQVYHFKVDLIRLWIERSRPGL